MLAGLQPRAQEVLSRRYGLSGGDPETLEEIGDDFGVTRERIRQIEANALTQLRARHADAAAPLLRDIERHLHAHGALRVEDRLVEDFAPHATPQALLFLLDFGDPFNRHRETEHRHALWSVDADRVPEAEAFERALVEKLEALQKELDDAAFWEFVETEARRRRLALTQRARESWVGISRAITRGPRGAWGLRTWPSIVPHNVGDWAYLALREKGKPLHFTDIVSQMNRMREPDMPQAHVQTVHNELIRDDRFVLVGRGLYALREWGYEPGTVREVLERILRDARQPMTRDEVLKKVSGVRSVKPNTVILNLQNRVAFSRTADGKYALRPGRRTVRRA